MEVFRDFFFFFFPPVESRFFTNQKQKLKPNFILVTKKCNSFDSLFRFTFMLDAMYRGRKRASQLSDPPGILWQMMSRIKLQNTHFLPLLELGTSSVAKLLVLLHICHVFLRLSWSHRKREHVLLPTCYFHPSQSLFLTEV